MNIKKFLKKLSPKEKRIIFGVLFFMAMAFIVGLFCESKWASQLSGIAINFFADLIIVLGVLVYWEKAQSKAEKEHKIKLVMDGLKENLERTLNKIENNRSALEESNVITIPGINSSYWKVITEGGGVDLLEEHTAMILELSSLYYHISEVGHLEKLYIDRWYRNNVRAEDPVIMKLKGAISNQYGSLEEKLAKVLNKF